MNKERLGFLPKNVMSLNNGVCGTKEGIAMHAGSEVKEGSLTSLTGTGKSVL